MYEQKSSKFFRGLVIGGILGFVGGYLYSTKKIVPVIKDAFKEVASSISEIAKEVTSDTPETIDIEVDEDIAENNGKEEIVYEVEAEKP